MNSPAGRSPDLYTQLRNESKELFGVLASQFSDDFDPVNHTSEFILPLPESHPFFEAFNDTAHGAPLGVEVRYIPKLGKLDFATLRLPQKDSTTLLLKRPFARPDLFLPFAESKDRKSERLLTIGGEAFPLQPKDITKLLALADVCLPELFTTPEDYLLSIAELRRKSKHWSSIDERSNSYAPLRTLRFKQKLAEQVPDDITGSLLDNDAPTRRRATKRISSPRKDTEINPTMVSLTAINEFVETSGVRKQVVISFAGTFFDIGLPKIYGRTLRPDMLMEAFNIRDADPRNSPYTVTEYYDPLKTCGQGDLERQLELVKSMADVVMKVLLLDAK